MPRVLDVGQCGYDHGSIARYLKSKYSAEVTAADTQGQALVTLRTGSFDLVLVNRLFDGDGTPGLDLIRSMKADPELAKTPVMLVSNYADAQTEAKTLGALAGFGKGDLGSGQPVAALEEVLGSSA